jgi:hypothetical protein
MAKKKIDPQAKEIQKLKERCDKIEKHIEEQFSSLDQKFTTQISGVTKMLDDRFGELDQTIKTINTNFNEELKSLIDDIQNLRSKLNISQNNIQTQIDAKEEVLIDMIKKFDDQFTKDKRHITEELEAVKGQQDVLKISYTVNEKQLSEKIEAMITGEVRNACNDKEREILMNVWMKELKELIHDFEKLKKMHPREFNLKMNEIADTIEVFKHKIVK